MKSSITFIRGIWVHKVNNHLKEKWRRYFFLTHGSLNKCALPLSDRFGSELTNSSHCSTTILSKHITSALTVVKYHVMKYSETAFSNSNFNYFWSIKTLPRSSKSCDCVTFRVLKYLLSTFLLYTPHCHMILSKQKCCLWSTGVSTESQNLTSALHLKLYGRYEYTKPCMINRISGLKQL